jgi:hypothetical protein
VISAETNSGGTALLKTRRGNYVRKGAPVGAYKIVLVRHVAVTDEELPPLPPTATPKQTKEYLQKLQILTDSRRTVPKKLSSPKTTPLTIDVAGKGSTLDIDIAEYAQTSHVTTNN